MRQEFLKLEGGLNLILRPSNLKRYGLEPFSNSMEDFSAGVRYRNNVRVGYRPEEDGGRLQHWYLCKLNQRDGEDQNHKRIKREVTKKPGWFGEAGPFPGDCKYFAQRLDDVRKHFITHHPGISRRFYL